MSKAQDKIKLTFLRGRRKRQEAKIASIKSNKKMNAETRAKWVTLTTNSLNVTKAEIRRLEVALGLRPAGVLPVNPGQTVVQPVVSNPVPKPAVTTPVVKPVVKPAPVELTAREKFVKELEWGIANEPKIHYVQVRPMKNLKLWSIHALPLSLDCSEAITVAAHAAGLEDPNGLNYNGTGFTGTLLTHAEKTKRVISRSTVRPGDLVVYGSGSGVHVNAILEVTPTKLKMFSHGQEKGPLVIEVGPGSTYRAGQKVTYISVT